MRNIVQVHRRLNVAVECLKKIAAETRNKDCLQALKELEAEYESEYQFRAHEENGMEGYEDDHFQEDYERKKRAILAEMESRKQRETHTEEEKENEYSMTR